MVGVVFWKVGVDCDVVSERFDGCAAVYMNGDVINEYIEQYGPDDTALEHTTRDRT